MEVGRWKGEPGRRERKGNFSQDIKTIRKQRKKQQKIRLKNMNHIKGKE